MFCPCPPITPSKQLHGHRKNYDACNRFLGAGSALASFLGGWGILIWDHQVDEDGSVKLTCSVCKAAGSPWPWATIGVSDLRASALSTHEESVAHKNAAAAAGDIGGVTTPSVQECCLF